MKNIWPKNLLAALAAIFISYVQAQLDPTDLEIPMSDGEFLAADLYLPPGSDLFPVILIQTPYGKIFYELFGLPLGIGDNIENSNYAIVIVDWRGRFESADAAYTGAPTLGEDGYDVVEWIASQNWCDGNIGTWGPSALGNVQYQTARNHPPSLDCICPVVAGPQTSYDEYYPGGCYRTEYVEQLDALGFGFSQWVLANPVQNIVWTFAENSSDYPEEIHVPCFMIGGWYDHNTNKMIEFFNAIRSYSPTDVKDKHRLLMGPWVHGGSGQAVIGSSTQGELEYPNAGGYDAQLALQYFDYYLRNIENGWNETSFVTYYQMGENVWMESDAWPPPMNEVQLSFFPDETLRPQPPTPDDSSLGYDYDPLDPSPTVGGPTLRTDLEQGPYDQTELVESRMDILSFTTDVLAADVVVKGKPMVRLAVQATVPDTDFALRLCDVYPDGRSMLVSDGILRMRFRDGYSAADTALMQPATTYYIDIELPHTAITFLQDHRIRLDVSSSNYPRFNRNMNTGGEMYPDMNGDTLVSPAIASVAVFTNATEHSYMILPVFDYPIGVNEYLESCQANIFPNPVADKFQFISPFSGELYIAVLDASGKVIIEKKTESNTGETLIVNCEFLSGGLYTMVLSQGKKQMTGEFFKE